MQINKKFLQGKSGMRYEFGEVRKGDELPDMSGVYYLTNGDGKPIFFERTENFRERISELNRHSNGLDFTNNVRYHITDVKSFCKVIVEDISKELDLPSKEFESANEFVKWLLLLIQPRS